MAWGLMGMKCSKTSAVKNVSKDNQYKCITCKIINVNIFYKKIDF